MNKIRYFLVLILFVAVALTGCGQRRTSDEVIMWLVGSEAQSTNVNELAKKFYDETGIKVRCEAVPWGEAHFKYLTAVAGGVPPDIGTMGLTWGAEFGELGAMVDLGSEFSDDIKALEKDTFSGIWDSVEYKERVYGIPFDMTIHIMYYRKDIINRAPQTWEELASLLEKLNKDEKGMLFDWGSMEWIGYSTYLWQAGGNFYNDSYTESIVDSQESLKAMKFFTDLYTVYKVPKTKIPLEQGMRTGDFPIGISGNWKIIGLTIGAPEIKDKWGIATLPKGPSGKKTAFLGGRIMGIFSQAKNKEKAWEFMKFLFRPESQAYLYKSSLETEDAYLPPNTDSWKMLEMKPEFKKVLIAQALDAKGPPPVLGWDSTTRHIDQAIQRIILQKGVIVEELRTLKGLMDLELKRAQR